MYTKVPLLLADRETAAVAQARRVHAPVLRAGRGGGGWGGGTAAGGAGGDLPAGVQAAGGARLQVGAQYERGVQRSRPRALPRPLRAAELRQPQRRALQDIHGRKQV